MPKISKSFSISEEVLEKLKSVPNPSELADGLLAEYFRGSKSATQTLEEKRKEISELEDRAIQEKELERKTIEEELSKLQSRKIELDQEQARQLDENVTLIETQKELSEDLVKAFKDHVGMESEIITDKLLDFVDKYRGLGFRVGTTQIRNYLKTKGIFL